MHRDLSNLHLSKSRTCSQSRGCGYFHLQETPLALSLPVVNITESKPMRWLSTSDSPEALKKGYNKACLLTGGLNRDTRRVPEEGTATRMGGKDETTAKCQTMQRLCSFHHSQPPLLCSKVSRYCPENTRWQGLQPFSFHSPPAAAGKH